MTSRDKVRRLVYTLLVMACIAGLALAVSRTRRGDDDVIAVSGEVVEQLIPARDSEALQQQQIGVDLGPDYTGTLVVNGVAIPESQIQRRPELNQVFFQPGADTVIPELQPGQNCVTVLGWRVASETSADARELVRWCFRVT